MSKIVVIGANHAGTAAMITILDNYPEQEVVAIDRNSNISFLGCGMALWIGKQISGSDGLFYSNRETLEGKGATVHMETEVQSIDFDNKIVHAVNKERQKLDQPYDKLILATGSLPIIPDIKGKELKNVQQVKLFQNAQEVIDKLKDESIGHVTIVGAGYIGVELAEAFKRNGREVRMIDCAETCLSGYYDKEFTALMEEQLRSNGVDLVFGEMVKEIQGDEKVEKIVTDKGSYDTDMVVMAIGFRPNNALGKDSLELFANGAYVVDKTQKTSREDVYAVGDCATVYDNSLQKRNYIALATNAVRSGIIAAHNTCGTKLETIGVQGSNAISIWGLHMISTGLTLAKAKKAGFDAVCTDFEDYQKALFIENGNDKVKIRIVYDKVSRRVLGAQLCSKYDVSMGIHMFSLAVQEQVTIDKLKLFDVFFLPHFNQPYNYITMAALSAE